MTPELQPTRRRGRLGIDRGVVVLVSIAAVIGIGVIKPWGPDRQPAPVPTFDANVGPGPVAIASRAPLTLPPGTTDAPSPSPLLPTAIPSRSPNPTPTPRLSEFHRKGAWVQIGWTGLGRATVEDLVGSAAGYVALADGRAVHSPDGIRWQPIEMHRTEGPCPFSYGAGVWAVDAAASRDAFLLYVAELADCRHSRGATIGRSWLSDDAAIWQGGLPISDEPVWVQTWAVDGGWEALVRVPSHGSLDSWIWRSDDGLRWSPVTRVEFDGVDALNLSGVGWDGTRALAVGPSTLVVSADGLTWEERGTPFVDAAGITAIVAPARPGAPWLVATYVDSSRADFGALPTIWLSYDLDRWEQSDFPNEAGRVENLIATPGGYLAHVTPCRHRRNRCEPQAALQFLSDDGMEWRELPSSFGDTNQRDPILLANGTAGVLAFRRLDSTVWWLDEDPLHWPAP